MSTPIAAWQVSRRRMMSAASFSVMFKRLWKNLLMTPPPAVPGSVPPLSKRPPVGIAAMTPRGSADAHAPVTCSPSQFVPLYGAVLALASTPIASPRMRMHSVAAPKR